jgi:hypothetical protein
MLLEGVVTELDLAAVRQLLDRQEIWDCLLNYTRGMDRMDAESCKAAYHVDGWDDHGRVVMPGQELADYGIEYHRLGHRYTQHMLTNHKCEIDGDTANAETYFLFFGGKREGGSVELVGGRYIDQLERRDGQWKIANRLCLIEWRSSLVEGAPGDDDRSTRSRADASYMRPLVIRTERKEFPLS